MKNPKKELVRTKKIAETLLHIAYIVIFSMQISRNHIPAIRLQVRMQVPFHSVDPMCFLQSEW